MSRLDLCTTIPRCNLVYTVKKSKRSDIAAQLTMAWDYMNNVSRYNLVGGKWDIRKQEEQKMLISIEGNDLASGLKWMLYSTSVVLMVPPTKMSFALENFLEPWIHFVPLKADWSDLEKMVDWVHENDGEAEQIALNGKTFISDLLFGEEAELDNALIREEMALRYHSLWSAAIKRYQARHVVSAKYPTLNKESSAV